MVMNFSTINFTIKHKYELRILSYKYDRIIFTLSWIKKFSGLWGN